MKFLVNALASFVMLSTLLSAESGWTLETPDATTAKVALLPFPVQVDWRKEDVSIGRVQLDISKEFSADERSILNKQLERILSTSGVKQNTEVATYRIVLQHGKVAGSHIPEEAYILDTQKNGVTITAQTAHGLFNGLQTFRQLIHQKAGVPTVAGCSVRDWPAFRTRGVMLDVARRYMSPSFLMRHIEKLSQYKINVFHMHLTEDQAWRLQVTKHPKLTQGEFHWQTRQPGKYYTHEELRDLVAFCQERHVEIIPEVDMPGHSAAFKRAMGVSMQSDKGIAILKDVLDDVVEIFPSNRIHIGSDEVHITMKEFMPTMVAYVRGKGKYPIVWSPGHRPDEHVITMHWGDHMNEQVDPDMRHISTIGFYMDWIDSQSGVYQYFFQQPCDVPQGNDKSQGAITCVWADGALSSENRVIEQYPFYPCSLTFAERIWRGAKQSRPDLFGKLPQPGTDAYRAFAEFENRLVAHRDKYFSNIPFAYVKQSHIPWRLIGPFDHKGKNDTSFEPEKVIKDSYKDGDNILRWEAQPAWGSAIHIRHLYSVFNKHLKKSDANYWPATMNHRVGTGDGTCYALTYIHSEHAGEVHFMFGIGGQWGHTGGYRTARAPEQGSWDFAGGDLWLNDRRVDPPLWPFKSLPWSGWGKGRIEEQPLTQEGYFFRPPVRGTLKKGWNKVLVRVPFGWWKKDNGQRKWFFNLAPVTWDGCHYREVEGIKFSPVLPTKQNE